MTTILINNVRIALPNGQTMHGEILIEEGKIARISTGMIEEFTGRKI